MVKGILVFLAVFGLLLLDFAALDDITTGNESDYTPEYFTLGISGIIFVVLLVLFFYKRRKDV